MKAAEAKHEEAPRITRALRLEIDKPVGFSWDELGQILRDRRAIAHRLINTAIIGIHVEARQRNKGANGSSLRTLAYQLAGQELASFKEWASKQKEPRVKRYADVSVPAGMQSAWADCAFTAWKKWSRSNGEDGFPTMRRGQPIIIRSSNDEWAISEDDARRLVLTVNLDSTKDHMVGKRRIFVRPGQGAQWEIARKLAAKDPNVKRGDLKFVYDERARRKDGRKGKWYALLAYSVEVAPRKDLDASRVLVVHRGYHNLLTVADNRGFWRKLVSGKKLAAQKERLRGRRRSLQESMKRGELGTGGHGHGRKRLLRPITDLEDLEARIVKTTVEQAAAEVVKVATRGGCGRVVIGDYGGIEPDEEREIRRFVPRLPAYALKQAIKNALEKAGVSLDEVSESYVSTTCPQCGVVDAGAHHKRTGIFHCRSCGLDREADWVSTMHMLRRVGCDMSVWEKRLKFVSDLAKRETEDDKK